MAMLYQEQIAQSPEIRRKAHRDMEKSVLGFHIEFFDGTDHIVPWEYCAVPRGHHRITHIDAACLRNEFQGREARIAALPPDCAYIGIAQQFGSCAKFV